MTEPGREATDLRAAVERDYPHPGPLLHPKDDADLRAALSPPVRGTT